MVYHNRRGGRKMCVLESSFPMRYLDLAVILVYLIGITWFGARFRHLSLIHISEPTRPY